MTTSTITLNPATLSVGEQAVLASHVSMRIRLAIARAAESRDQELVLLACFAHVGKIVLIPVEPGAYPEIDAPAWSTERGHVFVRHEVAEIHDVDLRAQGTSPVRSMLDRVQGVVMHEVGHVLYRHIARARDIGAPADVANVLGDCEIHRAVPSIVAHVDPWMKATSGGESCTFERCCPEEYAQAVRIHGDHVAWENVYAVLPPPPQKKQGQGGQGQGQGQGKPAPKGCGSTQAGASMPGTIRDEQGREVPGPLVDANAVKRAAQGAIEKADAIARAAGRGRGGGHVSRALRELADMETTHRVPWRTLFRRALASAVQGQDTRETYARPNRRQTSFGAVIRKGEVPQGVSVAVIVDVSGSMSSVLPDIMRETAGLAAVGASFFAVAWDTRECSRISEGSDGRALIRWARGLEGMGGTSTAPAYRLPEVQRADVVVFISDLDTDWPDQSRLCPRRHIVVTNSRTNGVPDAWRARTTIVRVTE